MIRKISDWKTQPLNGILIQPPLQQPSITAQQNVSQVFETIDPMQSTQTVLKEVSNSIDFIYNTPVVEKLRKISVERWYHLI